MPSDRKRKPEWNLAPSPTSDQHFVPRGYFRPFERQERFLRVFDLAANKERKPRSSKSVAVAEAFYDLDLAGMQLSAEDWLNQTVETPAFDVFHKLAAAPDDFLTLTAAEENAIARYLAASFFRGPDFRANMAATMAEAVSQAKQLARNYARNTMPADLAEEAVATWEALPDYRWLGAKEAPQDASLAVRMLSDVQGYANLFRTMEWTFAVADAPRATPLYTSGHPLSRKMPPVRGDFHWGALTDWDYQLPLSPTSLLRVRHWRVVEGRDPVGARRRANLSANGITVANALTSVEAIRFAYGDGHIISRTDASAILEAQDAAAFSTARELGWDPGPAYSAPFRP